MTKRAYPHIATIWYLDGERTVDAFGRVVEDDAWKKKQIRCRWTDVNDPVFNADGTQLVTKSKIFPDPDEDLDSILQTGDIKKVKITKQAAEDTNDREAQDVFALKKVDYRPNYTSTKTYYQIML